jgi:hypothetical protein
MKCDSWASLLAHTLTSPYFGCEPMAKVATKRKSECCKRKTLITKLKIE